jgi:hypothetical protein
MSELLTLNNDIMDIIVKNLDTDSHLIVGLTCKEMYKILKTTNENKKLIGSLKYLTSNLTLLKYGHKNGCPLSTRTIKNIFDITNKESLECLKYLHENDCPWSESTSWYAAKNGQLECLKYLHENGCPWSDLTTQSAAEGGHLDCLKYAHENGCPWTLAICANAADGHLDCLKYAHENGCPWSANTILQGEWLS